MSAAEVLRRAASLMRERAEAAVQPTARPGRWIVDLKDPYASPHEVYNGPLGHDSHDVASATDNETAEHIASWHPAVALAVADWLDDAYMDWHYSENSLGAASVRAMSGQPNLPANNALAVARAYLGSES